MSSASTNRSGFEPLEPRLLLSGDGLAHVGTIIWQGEEVEVYTGPWIAKLDPVAATGEGLLEGDGAGDIANPIDASDIQQVDYLGDEGLYRIQVDPTLSYDQLLSTVGTTTGFQYLEPDFVYNLDAFPNDTLWTDLYGLHNTGQSGGNVDSDIDAPEAWDITTGSTDVVVGVIDTGVDYRHPDLYLNIWLNQGEIPATFASSLVDFDGHNAQLTYVATDAGTYTIRVLSEGDTDGEYLLLVDAALSSPRFAGDLDGDGYVGLDDLDIILNNWNALILSDPRADVNGDGIVGLDDLDFVLDNWNTYVAISASSESVSIAQTSPDSADEAVVPVISEQDQMSTQTPIQQTQATSDRRPQQASGVSRRARQAQMQSAVASSPLAQPIDTQATLAAWQQYQSQSQTVQARNSGFVSDPDEQPGTMLELWDEHAEY